MTCVVTHLQNELRIWTIKDEPKEWECKGSTRKYNRAPGSTTVLRESGLGRPGEWSPRAGILEAVVRSSSLRPVVGMCALRDVEDPSCSAASEGQ